MDWKITRYNKNRLKGFRRSLEVIVADSKVHYTTDLDWLQGGKIAIICGNVLSLIQKRINKDRWVR